MKIISKMFLILITLAVSFTITTNFALAKYKCGSSGTAIYDSVADCVSTGCASSNCISETGADSGTTVKLTNPLTGTQSSEGIPVLLGKIISSILGIVGSLALVMFIYGGITWMTSAGNQEQVTKGKNILIWATIGIVIIFTAYALVRFVLTTVTLTG